MVSDGCNSRFCCVKGDLILNLENFKNGIRPLSVAIWNHYPINCLFGLTFWWTFRKTARHLFSHNWCHKSRRNVSLSHFKILCDGYGHVFIGDNRQYTYCAVTPNVFVCVLFSTFQSTHFFKQFISLIYYTFAGSILTVHFYFPKKLQHIGV